MQAPAERSYDVVIVGGAMIGSAIAWFLTDDPGFTGRVLVIERDPSYSMCSTAHTNSCIRQQFSAPINIHISQFGADFVKNFKRYMRHDPRLPQPVLQNFGYLYLADTEAGAQALQAAQAVQAATGAGTRHMRAAEIGAEYPFYHLDDIVAGNHNTVDEGYFDGATLFDWWKRIARERGVTYLHNEVTGLELAEGGTRVTGVRLATGETIGCGVMVNCAGPRAARVAAMAGIALPVEPRKRYTYVFQAEAPLSRDLPLTIDPSGVHMRTDGRYYMAGCPPDDDPAVEPDDFAPDHSLWEEKVWPVLAHRVPSFERIRLMNSWVGHYAYNTLDQNAVLGPHDAIGNFIFANGFSGHGFQQSPAVGRGIAEWIVHGGYRTLDLSPFGYDRIRAGRPFVEHAVI